MQYFQSFAAMNSWSTPAPKVPARGASNATSVAGLRSRLTPTDPRLVRLAACARAAKLRGLHRELRRADGASVRLIIDRPYSIVDRAINPATWIKLQFSTGTLTLAFGKT